MVEDDGWSVIPHDSRVAAWAAAARQAALAVVADPVQRARWLRHGQTWFVGVDALPSGPDGSIGGVPLTLPFGPLPLPLHPAQLSVVWPGYPGRDRDETDAAHRFRKTRDAAHLDGLLAEGPQNRRHLREPHAFVLGLPLTACDAGASPLVIWQGSPAIIRAAFAQAFAGVPPDHWGDIDVTETYQTARARVFAECTRVPVPLLPGQAVLMHRHAIHGVAPWEPGAHAPPEGRMVAYFRPLVARVQDWLDT